MGRTRYSPLQLLPIGGSLRARARIVLDNQNVNHGEIHSDRASEIDWAACSLFLGRVGHRVGWCALRLASLSNWEDTGSTKLNCYTGRYLHEIRGLGNGMVCLGNAIAPRCGN